MGRDVESLVLQMSADLRRFEKSMTSMKDTADRRMTQVERRAIQNDRNLQRIFEQSGKHASSAFQKGLAGLAPAIAAGFSAKAVIDYADSYTSLQNRLKAAGLEGQRFQSVENGLYDIANRNNIAVGAAADLYQRASLARENLGASDADLMKIVSGTAAALKLQGTSATEASGALLQLGQLLGGTKVQSQEFNSLIDGLPVLLKAVAEGSDRWGGSVNKLTLDVKAGKVSTQEFAQAMLKGFGDLETRAGQATTTVSGALQVLNNELGRFIGQTDKSLSATQQMAQAIEFLAKNLQVVVTTTGILVALIGSRAVVAFIASTAATIRDTMAKTAATVQAEAYSAALLKNVGLLNAQAVATAEATAATAGLTGGARVAGTALLGAFGGPVVIAITAVVAGLGLLAVNSAIADAKAQALRATIDGTAKAIDREKTAAAIAAQEHGKMVAPLSQAEVATANLTGEVNKLADAHYRAANEAKNQRIQEAQLAVDSAKRVADDATKAAQKDRADRIRGATLGGGVNAGTGGGGTFLTAGEIAALEAQSKKSDAAAQASQAQSNLQYYQDQLDRIKKESLKEFLAPSAPETPTSSSESKKQIDQIVSQVESLYDAGLTESEKAQKEYRENMAILDEAFAKGLITDLQRQMIKARLGVNLDQVLNPISEVKPLELGDVQDKSIELVDTLQTLPSLIHPIRDELTAISHEIADSLGEAIAYGDDLGDALANSFRRIAAAWISEGIDKIFQALIHAGTTGNGGGIGGGAGNVLSSIFKFIGFKEGRVPGYAAGRIGPDGRISGPGTGTSDSILAMGDKGPIRVSDDEAIINAASTKKYGALLKAINTGRLKGFATGRVPNVSQFVGAGASGGEIGVSVAMDRNGNLQAYIERVSGNVSAKVTSAGIGKYDKHLEGRVNGINRDPRRVR